MTRSLFLCEETIIWGFTPTWSSCMCPTAVITANISYFPPSRCAPTLDLLCADISWWNTSLQIDWLWWTNIQFPTLHKYVATAFLPVWVGVGLCSQNYNPSCKDSVWNPKCDERNFNMYMSRTSLLAWLGFPLLRSSKASINFFELWSNLHKIAYCCLFWLWCNKCSI